MNINCLLLNCNPIERTNNAISILSDKWNREWGIYPNLGIGEPSSDGNITDFESDKDFISSIQNAIDYGASIIGGCCGSNSNHITILNKIKLGL